jgi:hypothetical protein
MPEWARCNRDGKPIHPEDQKVINEFREWLKTPPGQRPYVMEANAVSAYPPEMLHPNGEFFMKSEIAECPYCFTLVYGLPADIDSGLRKHIDQCEMAPSE